MTAGGGGAGAGAEGAERGDALVKIGCGGLLALTAARARWSFSKNSPRFSEESEPPSGLPEEYMVASLPSSTNRNQPLLPFDSSSAAASDQM